MAANTNKDFGVPSKKRKKKKDFGVPVLPLCSNYYYGNSYFSDLV